MLGKADVANKYTIMRSGADPDGYLCIYLLTYLLTYFGSRRHMKVSLGRTLQVDEEIKLV